MELIRNLNPRPSFFALSKVRERDSAVSEAYAKGLQEGKAQGDENAEKPSVNVNEEVKRIMNNVFYMLRNEFEADESYNGADIRAVVLKTIKEEEEGEGAADDEADEEPEENEDVKVESEEKEEDKEESEKDQEVQEEEEEEEEPFSEGEEDGDEGRKRDEDTEEKIANVSEKEVVEEVVNTGNNEAVFNAEEVE
ncbi:PREDICTED: chromo domain-containing protein cec-1-like, partial [Acropora digitifera]|uniref:chromo domain-containing protein cec-1-like n=1 Tax=Acropora digitifera TaxID=70779 RepID=UPI00077B1DD6